MWTTSYVGSNSGYQHFIELKGHLGSAASFVQNQRLSYKLVDFESYWLFCLPLRRSLRFGFSFFPQCVRVRIAASKVGGECFILPSIAWCSLRQEQLLCDKKFG